METTERLVQTWMASGRDQEVDQAVSDISNGQTTLLHVVKALGEYLTAEEDLLRTKGVDFLSSVVARCPPGSINRQSTRVLVTFYISKLDDTETIIPALKGFVPLTSLPTLTSPDVLEIMTALFTHVNMKAHVQSTRYLVFAVIDSLMARHRDALKSMGHNFLSRYTTLADGEKDPRNLMLAFSIDRVICIEFNISKHVENLFNITYCYFPITFKPPSDDPYGITPDELRRSLRSCLNATPAFGPLAIPLFLEKLTVGSPATKKDTLQTMSLCLPVFGPGTGQKFAQKLWISLKLEIFQPTDSDTESGALEVVQVLIRTIYSAPEDDGNVADDVHDLAKDICEECLEVLRQPEKSQAKPAIKVLAAMIGTTPSISHYTLSQAIPYLIGLFRSSNELSNRPQILALICNLIAAATAQASASAEQEAESALMSFKGELLRTLNIGVLTSNTRGPALDGLKMLPQIKHFLTDEELGSIVHNINEVLESDGDEAQDARDGILDVLITISNTMPRHVEETTLPLLFSSLPDHAPAREAYFERAKYWRTLQTLTKLCILPPLSETFVIRLSTKLDLICAPVNHAGEAADTEPSAAYAHAVLKALADALEMKVDAGHVDVPKYIDRLLPRLYHLFIYLALTSDRPGGTYTPGVTLCARLLSVAANIISLIIRVVSAERQAVFAKALMIAYYTGNIKDLAAGHQAIPADILFQPFAVNAPSVQKDLVVLFAAAVIAFRKEVLIPDHEPVTFLTNTLTWSLEQADNSIQRSAAHHTISSLLNKHVEVLSSFLHEHLDEFWKQELADIHRPVIRRQAAIQGWVWITKALIVRNHQWAAQAVDRLFELFNDEFVCWDAAKAIGEIGSGGEGILTKRNHAVIRILFAQKYFNGILPRILRELKGHAGQSDSPVHTAYLVALVSLISPMPKVSYMHEMPTLVPLLLRALVFPDVEIRISVINILMTASETADQGPIAEHASTLVSVMLKHSSVHNDITSTDIRIAAIKYLDVLPKVVRYDILHPNKSSVIRELGKALDDPRRAVRKEAVKARSTWFTYNG